MSYKRRRRESHLSVCCAVVVVAFVITVASPKPSATSSPVPTRSRTTGTCTGAVLSFALLLRGVVLKDLLAKPLSLPPAGAAGAAFATGGIDAIYGGDFNPAE